MVEVHITLFCLFCTNSNGLNRGAAESAKVFFFYISSCYFISHLSQLLFPSRHQHNFYLTTNGLVVVFYCFFAGIGDSEIVVVVVFIII